MKHIRQTYVEGGGDTGEGGDTDVQASLEACCVARLSFPRGTTDVAVWQLVLCARPVPRGTLQRQAVLVHGVFEMFVGVCHSPYRK